MERRDVGWALQRSHISRRPSASIAAKACAAGLIVAEATFAGRRWLSRVFPFRPWAWPLGLAGLFVACFVLYAWIGPGQADTDGWFPLATSLLHGHLWIDGSRPWIELVPAANGQYYLPFPPIPAVVLVPIVAIFGERISDTNGVSALVGAVDVLLVVGMFRALRLGKLETLVLTFGFAFGSEVFYVAATGGVHHWTEVLTVMFLLGALNMALRSRNPWLVGVLFGLAVGCRPTALLAGPAFVVLYWRVRGWLATDSTWTDSTSTTPVSTTPVSGSPAPRAALSGRIVSSGVTSFLRKANWPGIAALALGAMTIGVWLAWANISRFGSPTEFGYDLIRGPDGNSVLSESWYTRGIVSPFYLARGLYSMLLRGWEFNDTFPWVQPNWAGCSVLFTTPILLFLTRARWRSPLILAGWLGLVLPVGLDLMHGNPGYAQFGYRFILDGLPFAWLLLGLVVARSGLTRGQVAAVALGTAINCYGLACISAGFVT